MGVVGCRKFAIFSMFIMAATAILDFQKFSFLTADGLKRPIVLYFAKLCVILPNFVQIGQLLAEIWHLA